MDSRRRKKPIPDNIKSRITKLFVSNLPEGCSGNDLATQVRPFGHIYDLYIARKRDKNGNRFGFISMLDVKNSTDVLNNLRGIRIGDHKLWFNIARFVLEEGEIDEHRESFKCNSNNDNNIYTNKGERQPYNTYNDNKKESEGSSRVNLDSFVSGSKSFRDLLIGRSVSIDSNVQAFSSLYGKAIIAKMVNVDTLKEIYVTLNTICPNLGFVQYLGGLEVLVSFDDKETASMVYEAANLMKDRFSSVSIWEGQSFGFERIAWLIVKGVPLHLCSNAVFDTIGGMFGPVVHKANISEKDKDLL